MKHKIIKLTCTAAILLAWMYDAYLSFSNISMTRTELFINYWWQYLITVIIMVAAWLTYQYIDQKEFDKIFNEVIKDIKKER